MMKRIEAHRIVPVVVLEDAKDALPLAEALLQGGLHCAEVTFRTDAAEESIRRIAKAYPEMLVGAGTVLTTEQVDRAVAAGASFIVSPGFNPRIVDYCLEKGIPMIPGCSTPSDIEQALERGLSVVKFFPAEAAGGIPMLKALSGPYRGVRFMPTGGISPANVKDYLQLPYVLACGGSWMVKESLVKAGEFGEIQELTRQAVELAASVKK